MKRPVIRILAVATLVTVLSLGNGTSVLAAVIAPTVATNAATYVAYSTARLNSSLVSDGGEACDVRFQYRESGGAWIDNETDWVLDTYTTGQTPWVDVEGLTSDTLHNFRVQAKNSEGTIVSGVSADFLTADTVEAPTELKAYPRSTSILLTWTKGAGSTKTTIRYSETTYPTSETEGIEGYEGVLSSYEVTGLTSGHHYYISAFGKSGTEYSASDTVQVTTTAGEAEGDRPSAPEMPTTWFQSPDYTVLEGLPLYDQVNALFEAFELPLASGWFFSTILGCILFAFAVYTMSKRPTPPLIALAVALGIASLIKLLPMFMMAFTVVFMIGAWHWREERR